MKTYSNWMFVFGLTALGILLLAGSCSSGDDPDPVDCSSLAISAPSANITNPSGCGTNNGSLTVVATGGQEPYQFSLNGGAFQGSATFSGLGGGTYTALVKDANGCEKSVSGIVLTNPGSNLDFTAATVASGCGASGGSITVTAMNGSGNYHYRLDAGSFVPTNVFGSLSAGNKSITVRDEDDQCTVTKSVRVFSGISYATHIQPIISTRCAVTGCHVSGGAAPFTLLNHSQVAANAQQIKAATQSGAMPKEGDPLTTEQKNTIACWVDDGAPNN